MAVKEYLLDDITVKVYKRAGSRSLRLSVTATGDVRVTIPSWSPFKAGLQFAKSRLSWIKQQQTPTTLLLQGSTIGKSHRLVFVPQASARISSRIRAGDIVVGHPRTTPTADPAVQAVAKAACIRALRKQAEALLPDRLELLASQHGFAYRSVSVKQLKSRWGSCDQQQNIVLNQFLMQLPWHQIDYVLVHELIHTKVMHHGPAFWQLFESVLPNARLVRAQMREQQPMLKQHLPESIG